MPKKKVLTMGLTALMCLGSTSSFWDLPTSELDKIALNPLSVTVYAAQLPQFKDDIPDWASSDISYLVGKGIIKGYEDGTFKAQGSMTVLEFLTATVRSLKTDAEIDSLVAQAKANTYDGTNDYKEFCNILNKSFKEAGGKYASLNAETFWGTKYLLAADLLGLIYDNGYLNTTGVPLGGDVVNYDVPITRQEACTVMYNACTKVRGESLPETKGIHNIIPDYNSITIDRAKAVGELVSNGLIAGVDDNFTFAPKQTLTRAQACAIIARITDTSRRLSKPTVPEDKQEYINSRVERDITFHNPVTGQDETRDINEWVRLTDGSLPSYRGSKDGEYSPNGYFQWNETMGFWINLVNY